MRSFRLFVCLAFAGSAVLLCGSSARAEEMTSSLEKLVASGQSVSCTFDKKDENGSQTGTVFVADNKMSGDFTITQPSEGTFLMHMVRDGDWSYTWGGPMGENQGIKMKITEADAKRAQGSRQGPDMAQEMNFQCQPWVADAGRFQVPGNVEFSELGSMMAPASAPGGGTLDMKQMQCAACDQAPEGPDRDQCREILGCS